jgi:hypothetical protein
VWRGWPARISSSDREVLFVAAELSPHHEFVLRSDGEQFAKRRYFNGRTELSYRYEHPDPAAEFQLASRVIAAPTRAEARDFYQRLAGQLDVSAAGAGYTFEERPSFPWGDAVRYGVLQDGEAIAGHVLACRAGEKVFCLELSGVGLDDSQWGELISSAMQSLESYPP